MITFYSASWLEQNYPLIIMCKCASPWRLLSSQIGKHFSFSCYWLPKCCNSVNFFYNCHYFFWFELIGKWKFWLVRFGMNSCINDPCLICSNSWGFGLIICSNAVVSPSNDEDTFTKSTRTQSFSKIIQTLSCWYSLDSSRWVLSDEYPYARVSVIFQVFASFCIGQIIYKQHKG